MQLKQKIQLVFSNNKWVIYVIGLFIGIAMGIINPLASTHLKENNVGSLWIGIVSSSFFLFVSIGSIYIDKNLRNTSIQDTMIVGGMIAAVAVSIFPFVSNLFILLLLMMIIGFCIGLNMVGVQTILQALASEDVRGIINGVYSLYFAIGFVLSTVIGPVLYEYKTWIPFMFSSVTLLLCLVIVKLSLKEKLVFLEKTKVNTFKKVSIGLQGAFLYGFTETTLTTLYPVFLIHQKYNLSELGYALGIFVLGSIVGIIPITYISDRFGRERTLIISIVISIFTFLGIAVLNNFALRLIFSFLSGLIIGPIYPIALAISVQNLNKEEMASGISSFTSFYGIGSTIGPIISSVTMSLFGDDQIFSVCLVLFTIFIFTIYIKRGTERVQSAS
jgi:MFS family permease